MSILIVTGAAGFIGSNLVETLLNRGETVIGVDEFNDYDDPDLKRKNIARFEKYRGFELVEGDILSLNWRSLLSDAKVIFHQATQAGVRTSWGDGFRSYTERNINSTQVLLEAAKDAPRLQKFV